jgi:hypothetical protein
MVPLQRASVRQQPAKIAVLKAAGCSDRIIVFRPQESSQRCCITLTCLRGVAADILGPEKAAP